MAPDSGFGFFCVRVGLGSTNTNLQILEVNFFSFSCLLVGWYCELMGSELCPHSKGEGGGIETARHVITPTRLKGKGLFPGGSPVAKVT